jgi:hypothetical protein
MPTNIFFFQPSFTANGDDACGCHIPLGGVVVIILPMLRLLVKILDLAVSMVAVLSSLLSWGIVVEPRFHSVSFLCFRSFGFSVFSFIYL